MTTAEVTPEIPVQHRMRVKKRNGTLEPVDVSKIVDAADVRVRHLPRHPDFLPQLRQPRRIALDISRKKLQRHRLLEREIVGEVDLTHAAPPEPPHDPIAAAKHLA